MGLKKERGYLQKMSSRQFDYIIWSFIVNKLFCIQEL